MPINNYVGQALTTEQEDIIKPQPEAQYSPVQISPDLTEARALSNIANNLNKIAQTAKAINDYNDETRIVTDVIKINNQAIQEKWTPDQYQKQLQNYLSKIKFDNPELQAQVIRKIDMLSVDTATKLTAIHTKLMVQQTLANLDEMSQYLINNVSDEKSYMQSLAVFEGALQDAVNKKILDPVQVQKLKDGFRQQALNNLMMSKMQANPDGFIQELKSGKFDGVISETEKAQLIQNAKQYKLETERQTLQQLKYETAMQSYHYLHLLNTGKMNYAQFMSDPNIPAPVKAQVSSTYNVVENNNPEVWHTYSQLSNQILQGVYTKDESGLWDAIKADNIPRQMALNLMHMNTVMQGKTVTKDGILDNKIFSNQLVKDYAGIVKNNALNALRKTYGYSVGRYTDVTITKNTETQIMGKAQYLFHKGLLECTEQSNEVECLNNLPQIANHAIVTAMTKFKREHFFDLNKDVFANIAIEPFDDSYSAYSDMAPNVKAHYDPTMFEGLKQKVADFIYQNMYLNPNINPTNDYKMDSLFAGYDKFDKKGMPAVTIHLTKSAQQKYKIPFLMAHLKYDDGQIVIIPSNKNLWKKVFSNEVNTNAK